jgi:hypothetical protein
MRLKGRGDFICCLQRLVDGPVPRGVVNHAASIPRSLPGMRSAGHPRMGITRLPRRMPGCGAGRQALPGRQTRPPPPL